MAWKGGPCSLTSASARARLLPSLGPALHLPPSAPSQHLLTLSSPLAGRGHQRATGYRDATPQLVCSTPSLGASEHSMAEAQTRSQLPVRTRMLLPASQRKSPSFHLAAPNQTARPQTLALGVIGRGRGPKCTECSSQKESSRCHCSPLPPDSQANWAWTEEGPERLRVRRRQREG